MNLIAFMSAEGDVMTIGFACSGLILSRFKCVNINNIIECAWLQAGKSFYCEPLYSISKINIFNSPYIDNGNSLRVLQLVLVSFFLCVNIKLASSVLLTCIECYSCPLLCRRYTSNVLYWCWSWRSSCILVNPCSISIKIDMI